MCFNYCYSGFFFCCLNLAINPCKAGLINFDNLKKKCLTQIITNTQWEIITLHWLINFILNCKSNSLPRVLHNCHLIFSHKNVMKKRSHEYDAHYNLFYKYTLNKYINKKQKLRNTFFCNWLVTNTACIEQHRITNWSFKMHHTVGYICTLIEWAHTVTVKLS